MENLNAEQIKKALEHCINRKDCSDCVIKSKELRSGCIGRPRAFFKNALALINSQEQKIKELPEENERLRDIEKTAEFYQREASRLAEKLSGEVDDG